ncbi:unnamed protein product [Calypogeia fissa]
MLLSCFLCPLFSSEKCLHAHNSGSFSEGVEHCPPPHWRNENFRHQRQQVLGLDNELRNECPDSGYCQVARSDITFAKYSFQRSQQSKGDTEPHLRTEMKPTEHASLIIR